MDSSPAIYINVWASSFPQLDPGWTELFYTPFTSRLLCLLLKQHTHCQRDLARGLLSREHRAGSSGETNTELDEQKNGNKKMLFERSPPSLRGASTTDAPW